MSCITSASRFRGPQAERLQRMLRSRAKRVVRLRRWQVFALDGYAWLVRKGWVVRVDWCEFQAYLRDTAPLSFRS